MAIHWLGLTKLLCAWLRSVVVVSVAWMLGLPGTRFAYWMLVRCWKLFRSGYYSLAWEYTKTPVACTRFFEFDFAERYANWRSGSTIVDVSSPRILSLYCGQRVRESQTLTMMNPDVGDIEITKTLSRAIGCDEAIVFVNDYANAMHFEDETVDAMWCISVVEHIPEPDDRAVLQEMQRVMRPGGRLIITTNVDKNAWDEYRDENTYGLSQNESEGERCFFQRWYDEETVTARIRNALTSMTLTRVAHYGEKTPGWFADYTRELRERWAKLSRNDPLLMARHFKRYERMTDMPGQGVICMCFEKRTTEDTENTDVG